MIMLNCWSNITKLIEKFIELVKGMKKYQHLLCPFSSHFD